MKKFVLNRARAARHDPFRSKRGSIPSDIIGELHHRSSYPVKNGAEPGRAGLSCAEHTEHADDLSPHQIFAFFR